MVRLALFCSALLAVTSCQKKPPPADDADEPTPTSANASGSARVGGAKAADARAPRADVPTNETDSSFVSAAGALGESDAAGPVTTAPGAVPTDDADAGPARSFRKANIEPAELQKIFATVPELVRVGAGVRYFTEGDVRAIVARSNASREGITFMTSPILWSPQSGVDLLVAAGRSKTMSFVVALWPLGGGRYSIASSFLMLNDVSPVVLAFDPAHRKELRWTACWGCPGEQGFVSYRPEERRVVIVQQ